MIQLPKKPGAVYEIRAIQLPKKTGAVYEIRAIELPKKTGAAALFNVRARICSTFFNIFQQLPTFFFCATTTFVKKCHPRFGTMHSGEQDRIRALWAVRFA